ncbi:MAG: chalcone isomerase family protein [Acidobacteriota bacterium]
MTAKKMLPALLIAALFPLTAPPAQAEKLAGVELPNTARVGETDLVLNGLGLRKKAIFKVYVAGLYLAEKQSDPEAILAADSPRKLVMEFLRKVGSDSLTGAWTDCLKNNAPSAGQDVVQGFDSLKGYMADVKKGDQLEFTYAPGAGTVIRTAGEERGTIAGKDFADTLFSCWVGAAPPSEDFKKGLLGG